MGAFFWGGLGKGLGKGMEDQQNLQLKRDEAKLRTRMLDAQIKHQDAQQRVWDQKELDMKHLRETRIAAAGSFKQAITGGTEAEPMVESPGDPAIAPGQVEGQPGAAIAGRPMKPHEIALHAMISDPTHQIPGAALRAMGGPTGGSGIDRAFATPQEAMAFRDSPEGKSAFPLGSRLVQNSRGWSLVGMNPSDPTANAFHAGLQGPGGRPAAEEARAGMLYGGAANTAAGRELGGAAATMGVPIPQRPGMAGQVPGGPMAPGGTPQVAPGSTAGGLPLPQAAKQAESKAGATGKRQVEAQEKLKDIASTEEIITDIENLSNRVNTSAASNPVGRIAGGLKKAAGAFLQTDTDAADLTRLRNSFSLSLARSILAERGVLTNQDREYATASIPGLYDSKELAQRSIFRLKSLTALQRSAEEALANGKPFDVEAFRQRWRQIAAPAQPTPQGGAATGKGRLVPLPRQ